MLFQFVLLRLTNSFGDGRGRDIRKEEKKKGTDLYDILLMFSFNRRLVTFIALNMFG